MGPNVLPWSLSFGLSAETSAPSLSIALAVKQEDDPGEGSDAAQSGARPLATCSSRCPRRQTVGPEVGSAFGDAVRSMPSSIELLSAASRCSLPLVVDKGRRLVEHASSPGPWLGIPRGLASLVRAPFAPRKGLLKGCLLARCATQD